MRSWVSTLVDRRGRRRTCRRRSRPRASAAWWLRPSCATWPARRPWPGRARGARLTWSVDHCRTGRIARRCALTVVPVLGIGEVRPGDDLAAALAAALRTPGARRRAADPWVVDGDVLVVTQKVVSKAEGRIVPFDSDDPDAKRALVESESVRVLRRRGDLLITETSHGFVCANAGIDLSNVEAGTAALLPGGPGPVGPPHPRGPRVTCSGSTWP